MGVYYAWKMTRDLNEYWAVRRKEEREKEEEKWNGDREADRVMKQKT